MHSETVIKSAVGQTHKLVTQVFIIQYSVLSVIVLLCLYTTGRAVGLLYTHLHNCCDVTMTTASLSDMFFFSSPLLPSGTSSIYVVDVVYHWPCHYVAPGY